MADADSAAKRYSIMAMGMSVPLQVLIIPDGTVAQGDRQHLLMLYSGIAAGSPSLGPTRGSLMLLGVGR